MQFAFPNKIQRLVIYGDLSHMHVVESSENDDQSGVETERSGGSTFARKGRKKGRFGDRKSVTVAASSTGPCDLSHER